MSNSPVSLLNGNKGDYTLEFGSATQEQETQTQKTPLLGKKRKRTPLSKPQKKDERKKVSRACDICKTRKLRCSGTLPCNRCANKSLDCEYIFEHRRGRPASPQPALSINDANQSTAEYPSTPKSQQPEHPQTFDPPISVASGDPIASQTTKKSSRSSQEADETQFEGDYIGPTSGIAFLYRAKRRFQQDFVSSISSDLDHQGSRNASVFSFGDGWVPDYSASDFVFPNRHEAKGLVDRYFDFAMPTYRFLHRATVNTWLENLCTANQAPAVQGQTLSTAKHAIVLLTLATAKLYGEDAAGVLHDGEAKDSEESVLLYTEAERKISKETGPVRLESVQARLAQCIYLLASSRINQAWYIFGTATQMILALGLHRKRFSQTAVTTSQLIEVECRKRVFWSAYTLDRYLSVILGRPRIFRDEDVNQQLLDRINDSDLVTGILKNKSAYNQCVSDGPLFHAKDELQEQAKKNFRLAKIIGGISSDLYLTNCSTAGEWTESAERWTAELKNWKDSLPPFLEPAKVDPSILVPIFQRQSTVLRLAYAHALILANRPSLLNNFGDLSRRQGLPQTKPEGSLKECIDAAILVVDTVNGFIEEGKMCKAFWFTHYISFCAIATLYVYTIQQSIPPQTSIDGQNEGSNGFNLLSKPDRCYFPNTQYFEAAEKCQQSIVETTAKTSPFRRYNIILDELKSEVLQRLGIAGGSNSNAVNFTNGESTQREMRNRILVDSSEGIPSRTPNASSTYFLDFGVLPDGLYPQTMRPLQAQGYTPANPAFDFRSSRNTFGQPFDECMLDLDLFGPQGELMGWSEFDSCAITWPDGLGIFEECG